MDSHHFVVYGVYLDNEQATLVYNSLKNEVDNRIYLKTPEPLKIGLFAEFANSSVHNLSYNTDTNQVFGVHYATDTLGDDIVDAMTSNPPHVVNHFEKYAKPFLTSLGILELPTYIVIEQKF